MSFTLSYQSLRSMSKLFGLLPFQIDRGKTGKIIGEHINFSDLVRSSIMILIYAACIVSNLFETNFKKPNLDQATVVVFFENFIFTSARYVLNISYVILDIINRKRFVDILRKFDTFDEEVKNNLNFQFFRLCNIKFHFNYFALRSLNWEVRLITIK